MLRHLYLRPKVEDDLDGVTFDEALVAANATLFGWIEPQKKAVWFLTDVMTKGCRWFKRWAVFGHLESKEDFFWHKRVERYPTWLDDHATDVWDVVTFDLLGDGSVSFPQYYERKENQLLPIVTPERYFVGFSDADVHEFGTYEMYVQLVCAFRKECQFPSSCHFLFCYEPYSSNFVKLKKTLNDLCNHVPE